MCLTEYDEEKVMLALREEYKEIGEEEGRELINNLNKKLRDDNQLDDLMRSLDDADFQKKLIAEYGV